MLWSCQKNARAKITQTYYGMDPNRKKEEGTTKEIWMEGVQEAMIVRGLEADQWMDREEWHLVSGRTSAELILQAFSHFTYVTAHSLTLPSLYLRHNSFSNPSVASPTSQLILQPFFHLFYVTGFSLTSPGEPLMVHIINQ